MLALLYLIIVLVSGYCLMHLALPWLVDLPKRQSLAGTSIPIPNWMIQLPTAWLLGALLMNWSTFVLSDLTRSMLSGAWLTLALGTILCIVLAWQTRFYQIIPQKIVGCWRCFTRLEALYLLFSLVLASFLAWHSLMVKDNTLLVGSTVWSDFGPHLAVIRSFSLGDNFPPQYPHYPDGSIRYHFMFQFMAGTLESLGMRLDWAFNIPSIFSLVSLFLLLYVLAVAITGQRSVGVLTGGLFIFRSSFAFFTHIKENLAGDNLWQSIWNVSLHIGKTEHESWGLWTQNVYANQRHFAFSICVLIVLLLSVLPLLQAQVTAYRQAGPGFSKRLTSYFAQKESWWPENWQRAITLGLLLGAIGFWNGAVMITALIILFVMAFFCRHRGEFLMIALLSVLLALLQQRWFIGTGASAVKPSWYFGFLADHKTLAGTAAYYLELLGLFCPLLLVSIFNTPMGFKALALAFIAPLIFASLVALTIDVTANHKFIMISAMLSNIFIAAFLVRLFQTRDNALRVMAGIFTVLLSVTGWVDLLTFYNMNIRKDIIAMNDPVTAWVSKNTNPKAVFLTDPAVLHPVQFAGRPIYYGWPYYAWSAGYNTDRRKQIMIDLYSTASAEALSRIAHQEGIDYIVIDSGVRNSREYRVNETLIAQSLHLKFKDEKDQTFIFSVD